MQDSTDKIPCQLIILNLWLDRFKIKIIHVHEFISLKITLKFSEVESLLKF